MSKFNCFIFFIAVSTILISCSTTNKLNNTTVEINKTDTVPEQQIETNSVYKPYLDVVLVYKINTNGFKNNNFGFDWNADGIIQDGEYLSESVQSKDLNEQILFQYLLDNFDRVPRTMQVEMCNIMKSHSINSPTDQLDLLDILGSKLSFVGLHPYSEKKIYYFPNGSGDKALSQSVVFYSSGSIKKLIIDTTQSGNNPFVCSIPNQKNKMSFWLYGPDRTSGVNWAKGYWEDMNSVFFYEDGKMLGIGVFPYAEFTIPEKLGCKKQISQIHGIRWHPDGEVYTILFDSEIQTSWEFQGNNIVNNPIEIEWWRSDPKFAVKIDLNGVGQFKTQVTKGDNTFYQFGKNGKIESFTRNFKNAATIEVYSGFFLSEDGKVTNYW